MGTKQDEIIGGNIKRLLDEQNISQKKFASMTGKAESTISDYLSGNTSVPAWLIADVAERFHISADSLLASNSQFDEKAVENLSPKTVIDCLLTLLIAFMGNSEVIDVPIEKTRFKDDRFEKKEEVFKALLIKDDYIDWILQRWQLYLRVVDEAVDSMWELRQALVIDFVKTVLMEDDLELMKAHLIHGKYNVLLDTSGKESTEKELKNIFSEHVEIPKDKLKFFFEDYKDKEGNEIGKQNREAVRSESRFNIDEEALSKRINDKVFLKRFLTKVYSVSEFDFLDNAVWFRLLGQKTLAVVELENVPPAFGGFTVKRGAGQYLVCIAAALPDLERARVFLHELSHVTLGHLESSKPVDELEQEAEEKAASLLELWESGEQAEELELLNMYNEKRGQVAPLRV